MVLRRAPWRDRTAYLLLTIYPRADAVANWDDPGQARGGALCCGPTYLFITALGGSWSAPLPVTVRKLQRMPPSAGSPGIRTHLPVACHPPLIMAAPTSQEWWLTDRARPSSPARVSSSPVIGWAGIAVHEDDRLRAIRRPSRQHRGPGAADGDLNCGNAHLRPPTSSSSAAAGAALTSASSGT